MLQAPEVLTVIFHGLKQWRWRESVKGEVRLGCAVVWLTGRLEQGRTVVFERRGDGLDGSGFSTKVLPEMRTDSHQDMHTKAHTLGL